MTQQLGDKSINSNRPEIRVQADKDAQNAIADMLQTFRKVWGGNMIKGRKEICG